MDTSSTSKRAENFSNDDKYTLLEIIDKYKHIIENKKTDAIFTLNSAICVES